MAPRPGKAARKSGRGGRADLLPEAAELSENDRDAAEVDRHRQAAIDVASAVSQEGVTVKLYRSHPQVPGGEAFVDELDGALFSEKYVREVYGGGKYRAEVIGLVDKGEGRRPARGKLRQESFIVDTTLPPKAPALAAGGVPVDPPPAASFDNALSAALNGATIQLLRGYQDMGNLQTAMLERALDKRPSVEWGPILAAVLPAAVGLIGKMLEGRPKPADMVRELKGLVDLAKDTQPAAAPRPRSALQEVRDALALVNELKGAGDGEGGAVAAAPWWADLARAGTQLLAQYAAPEPAAPVPLEAPASPTLAPPVVPAQPPLSPPDETLVSPLRILNPTVAAFAQFRGPLLAWARQGRPAEWVAETLLLELPAGMHDYLTGQLADAAVVPQIVASFGELAPFEPWLQRVRVALLEQLAADDADGEGAA